MEHESRYFNEEDLKQYAGVTEELTRIQQIYNLILEGATDYIYQLDIQKNICTFSPHALDVLPLETATFGNALETCLSFIVPEDRHVFLESFTPFLTGKSKFHTAEYRVLTKQGDIMWISCHGKGLHDEDGTPLVIAGSLMDITAQKAAEEKINKMLYFDAMTGVKNRYGFDKDLEQRLQDPAATGSVAYIDIKNFKIVNEIFGHDFGNEVLKDLIQMFTLLIPDNLGIYRLSGDEFVVHFPFADHDEIMLRLTPLLLRLRQPKTVCGHTLYISVNIGISVYPEHGTTPDEILKNADIAMISAPKSSKGSVTFYLDSTSKNISRRYQLEHELRASVADGFAGFTLMYQPIIETKTQQWMGAEALLRFTSPTLGAVPSDEVIEVLEYTAQILPVGKWVMQNAMAECHRWHQKGFGHFIVHINCSALQINDNDFVMALEKAIAKYQMPVGSVVCELTETMLINNMENALLFFKELDALGVKVALDDFGTGYSSLSYLRGLPLHQIKVDKSFAMDFLNDPYYAIVISSVNTLAEHLGMQVCAEGVEQVEVYEALKEMKVDVLQGFYFSKPLTAAAFYEPLV